MADFFMFISAVLRGGFSVFSMGAPVVSFDEQRWLEKALADDWRYLGGDIIPAILEYEKEKDSE